MKRQQLAVIVASVLCLGATAGRAQDNNAQPAYTPPPPRADYYYLPEGAGPYVRGGVGPAFFPDGKLTDFGGPAGNSVRYQTGFSGSAAVGYAFNRNVSADFEFGAIGAKIDSVPGFVSDDSRLYYLPFLGNVTLSLPIPHSNVVPYVGAGGGFAAAVFDTDNFGNGSDFVTGNESDVVPAGQLFAGVRFLITPNVSIGGAYKYFATGNPSFDYPPDSFNVRFRGARASVLLFTFDVAF